MLNKTRVEVTVEVVGLGPVWVHGAKRPLVGCFLCVRPMGLGADGISPMVDSFPLGPTAKRELCEDTRMGKPP
jgi:hypothetical protein